MGICFSNSDDQVHVGSPGKDIVVTTKGNLAAVVPAEFVAPNVHKTDHMSLRQLLADETARESFYKFLKKEFAEENLSFFMAADKVKNSLPSELSKSAEKLAASFLRPGSGNELNISDELRNSLNSLLDMGIRDNQTHKRFIEVLERAQNETLILMAMSSFPRFLESKDYQQWQERKRTGGIGQTELPGVEVASSAVTRAASVLEMKFTEVLDRRAVERALSSGSWLSSLLAAVENLPVCVSLSTARKSRLGFPLIYVNKYFEDTTGYSQVEIIGQNCRFLQMGKKDSDRSEPDSVAKLTKALRSATPVRVAITNFRKDGTAFRNLLAMKPIFDFSGNYSYVVGVQFDVSKPDNSAASFLMADKLLKMLPDKVMVPIDEQD